MEGVLDAVAEAGVVEGVFFHAARLQSESFQPWDAGNAQGTWARLVFPVRQIRDGGIPTVSQTATALMGTSSRDKCRFFRSVPPNTRLSS